MTTYDAIVVGAGAVGSAAMWRLAKRGMRVLGLDRYGQAHDQGSSHGKTRAIRQAYFEHPDYVPLLRRVYGLWDELEVETEQSLFFRVGLLEAGPADGQVVPGVLRSAAEHGLSIQRLTPSEARADFPAFSFSDDDLIVVENDAGYLLVEQAVQAQLDAALHQGAAWRCETVESWRPEGAGVEVATNRGAYRADRLVLAAGPWSASLLDSLQVPLQVVKKHQFWLRGRDTAADRALPVFFFEERSLEGPNDFFYGFPELDEHGLKVAEHSGGEPIRDPLTDPRQRDPAQANRVAKFVARRLPTQARQFTRHSVCFYTMTPDHHFLVDRHPQWPQVCFAAGLSGHGFKFAPALGEALADLCEQGATELEIQFLNLARFAAS